MGESSTDPAFAFVLGFILLCFAGGGGSFARVNSTPLSQGSVDGGSATWDDCGLAFFDELRVVAFPWLFPTLCQYSIARPLWVGLGFFFFSDTTSSCTSSLLPDFFPQGQAKTHSQEPTRLANLLRHCSLGMQQWAGKRTGWLHLNTAVAREQCDFFPAQGSELCLGCLFRALPRFQLICEALFFRLFFICLFVLTPGASFAFSNNDTIVLQCHQSVSWNWYSVYSLRPTSVLPRLASLIFVSFTPGTGHRGRRI